MVVVVGVCFFALGTLITHKPSHSVQCTSLPRLLPYSNDNNKNSDSEHASEQDATQSPNKQNICKYGHGRGSVTLLGYRRTCMNEWVLLGKQFINYAATLPRLRLGLKFNSVQSNKCYPITLNCGDYERERAFFGDIPKVIKNHL